MSSPGVVFGVTADGRSAAEAVVASMAEAKALLLGGRGAVVGA
jgi:hypothetical protein